MELLLELMTCTLASPSLDESCVEFKCLVGILESLDRFHQLDVSEGSVGVEELVVGVTLDSFVELLNGIREVSSLEELVSLHFVLFSDLWVDVGKSITLCLLLLDALHGLLDGVIVMLKQSFTVLSDRLVTLILHEEGVSSTSHSFSELHEVVRTFL